MMQLSAVKLRLIVQPPQCPLTGAGSGVDEFAAPTYRIEPFGGVWLRVTHAESGKARLYPIVQCMGADEAPGEAGQQQRHGGGR
jgi:hypothetical protein